MFVDKMNITKSSLNSVVALCLSDFTVPAMPRWLLALNGFDKKEKKLLHFDNYIM